jgi:hypothetical protein
MRADRLAWGGGGGIGGRYRVVERGREERRDQSRALEERRGRVEDVREGGGEGGKGRTVGGFNIRRIS